MSDLSNPSTRFITPEKGAELYAMQMQIFPNLREQLVELSGGSIGIVNAIISRVGDAISEDPMQETTVERVREVLGAPEDVEELTEWRSSFWDAFKEERSSR